MLQVHQKTAQVTKNSSNLQMIISC